MPQPPVKRRPVAGPRSVTAEETIDISQSVISEIGPKLRLQPSFERQSWITHLLRSSVA